MTVFETDRLIARDWTIGDAEAAFRMYGDPEVMRYIGTGATEPSLDSQRANLSKAIEKYAVIGTEGYGYWALELKGVGEVVGGLILKPIPLAPGEEEGSFVDIEIGWHLAKAHWGQGLATEAGRSLMELGLSRFPRLVAVMFPDNVASQRVADKIGMERRGLTKRYYDRELVWYEVLPK